MVSVWLIVAFLFLLLEIGSPGLFFFISFFCGSLFAAVAACMLCSLVVQMSIFLIGTLVSVWVLRYFVVPCLGRCRPHERTNVYALIGKQGVVIQIICVNKPGFAKIEGVSWVARALHDEMIEEGSLIEVVDVRGAHLIVKVVCKD